MFAFHPSFHLLHIAQGLQWVLLAQEEIAPTIIAMDGRHHRRPKSDETAAEAFGVREMKDHLKLNIDKSNFQNVRDVKLLRKLEAQGQFLGWVSVTPAEGGDIKIISVQTLWRSFKVDLGRICGWASFD